MLINCAKCKTLTPEFVNTASGMELHQFKWLANDGIIGDLPSRWNHLVAYDPHRTDASLLHYTIGGPWFKEYENTEYADEWFAEKSRMLSTPVSKVAAAS